ncbi:MAG: IS110 family transposase [Saprospiraceae bacterium]|nr:MAG: IS110 family transposase [Saprospiraceae bacterium]
MAQHWLNYGLGLDLSKDKIDACFGAKNQEQAFKIIAQRRFANTEKGYQALVLWLEKKRKDKTLSWQIALEVTGVYHEGVLVYLHDQGYPVCLELAKRVKRFFQSIGQQSKNDKLDGRGLAHLASERKLKLWAPISPQIYAIRSLLRHRKALMVSRVQFTNQLHAVNHSAVKPEAVKRSLEQMIQQLNKQIQKMEDQAQRLAKKDKAFDDKLQQIVDSVKGLGLISVLTVVAETNGFKEFYSIKQVVRYAGYDVIENQSGNSTGKTRISKQGNGRIRAVLYMPALAVIRLKVEPFYGLYQRLLLRNGAIKKKANVAVQRKLLVLIYTLWKKNQPFDERYYQHVEKQKKDKSSQKQVAPM